MKYLVLCVALVCLFAIAKAEDGRKCKEFWNQFSKTAYPTREQFIQGASQLLKKTISYSKDSKKRWYGINNSVCPPSVPASADCSGFTTWLFWTAFGGLPDSLHQQDWKSGSSHSFKGTKSKCQAGDVAVYSGHVATCDGNGKVINYGN